MGRRGWRTGLRLGFGVVALCLLGVSASVPAGAARRAEPVLGGLAGPVERAALPALHSPSLHVSRRVAAAKLVEPSAPYASLRSPIRIAFDQPVGNRRVIEAGLRIKPVVPGRAEWLDDQTLNFVPERLDADTSYTVELAGLGRTERTGDRWEWTFTTIKPITLSFDDCGRSGAQFDEMLDTIRAKQEQGYRVLFFPTGQCRAQYPRQFQRMVAMGPVCNHTYSHPRLTRLSDAGIAREIAGGNRVNCDLFRPPWGDWDGPGGRVDRIAAAQGYRVQMWDVETYDWAGAPAADIVAAVQARGGMVLLHLNGYHTLEALRQL